MSSSWDFSCWGTALGIAISFSALSFNCAMSTTGCAYAQISSDRTLPINSNIIKEGNTFNINGGTQVGGNLFHSFQEFSVPTGDTASFNNIGNIQNIISRVTGKSISDIDGLIRANGTANLFLINPNGIIFGPNASLNINGSFVVTTANAIGLANGEIFSTNPVEPIPKGLLNVNPSAFLFNQIAAPITVRSRRAIGLAPSLTSPDPDFFEPAYQGLKVSNGRSLLLVGGNVSLDGGVLQAPGGRVELGGALGSGAIDLNINDNNLSLNFPNELVKSDVSLTNEAIVDVLAENGGNITINARNLDIFNTILATGIVGEGTVDSQAGNITLNTTETMRIGQTNPIRTTQFINKVNSGTTGNTGDINLKSGSSLVMDSAVLLIENFGQGNAGNISVQTNGNTSFTNTSIFSAAVQGDPGNILFQVNGDLSFLNNSNNSDFFLTGNFISAGTVGQGNAGNILMYANGNISFANTYIESATSGTDKFGRGIPRQGNAASISIQANGNISFADSSSIDNSTTGDGDAGNVFIQANGNLSFVDDSYIQSSTPGGGNAGSVFIQANRNVSFGNNSYIQNSTTGEGNAGNVSIQANNNVSFGNDSYIFSTTEGKGKAGDIQILAQSLSLNDGAEFLATTQGSKSAGNIQIEAKDFVTVSGVSLEGFSSGLLTNTEEGASDQGGNITIRTGALNILDGAVLSAKSRSDFEGGDITVDVNTLKISGGGQILATAFSGGNAGSINVNATDSITLSGSDPTYFERLAEFGSFTVDPVSPASGLFSNTFTNSTGNGGTIELNTTNLTVADGAQVSASTSGQGDAGNVTFNANSLSAFNGGQLRTSTSASGQAGKITANVSEIHLSGFSSGLFAQSTGTGSSGDIALQPGKQGQSLTANFLDGAQISVSTSSSGKGGNLTILAPESITLSGSGTLTATSEDDSSGQAGDVLLGTEKLTIANGMRVSAATNSTNPAANGGNLTVQAAQLNLTDGSRLEAGTTGTAPGGNLTIQPNDNGQTLAVNFTGGATVSAASSGSGKGGTLSVNAPESINLTGNGSVISAETTRQGAGGDLTLTTGKLAVQDGAKITVNSAGSGRAGDLKINANSIYLNNAAKITADTTGGGGNIFMRSPLLLLRNQSSITTNAKGSGIPGGNIEIDAKDGFIIAVPEENSDISANSADFRGGKVEISAQGIFGIQPSNAPTAKSDITATGANSQFNGTIQLNTPDVDPSRSLVELPTIPVDTEVAQVCDSPGYAQSSFVITGRGGLPPNPTKDVLTPDTVEVAWVSLKSGSDRHSPRVRPVTIPEPIVEASGWAVNEKGEVVLTSEVNKTASSSWQNALSCSTSGFHQ
ncbi:MAG: filamentous hemagglutinin N-terminal domain-containing protein [Nostoc sp.]|uniref:two-partner secretion domain-containing protein n=1 Tax=Nostoc sp. TaxID=1180 RepID=UPI002FF52EDA